MKYKLLLLDIDGTLVASKGDALPSQRVIAVIKQAQELMTVAVATGRPKELAQPVIDALGLHGYGIFNGGTQVINTTTNVVEFEQLLSVEQFKKLVKLALPFGYPIFSNADQYDKPIHSPDEITGPAVKLFVEAVQNHDIPALIAELNSVNDVSAHPTTSWSDGDVMDVHVTHALATKRHGAERLMELIGCEQSEIMAIGDGYNDVPLLEAAGFKVAMGDAPDEVKAIADYVAPSLADDGVADAIERFIYN